ncbi:MAG: putative Zn-dependent protease [Lentimonas sp.]|jgi:predicted Zn-dependent protease
MTKHSMKALLSLIILLFSGLGFSQTDFNNYQSLISQGTVPNDFSTLTRQKVQDDIKNGTSELNNSDKKIFFEGVHYGVDQLLHSGLVTYNDPISNYVSEVADKLLESNPELRAKLRFYILKSNVANALSTDQGIVFFTTGLISQLVNEAQLAYILAHEITHYTEHHVVETFEYKKDNRKINKQIEQLSIYSKEKEYEADVKGIKLYHEVGYSKSYIEPTFDVLLYSYLPIDEIEFKSDYFNTEQCYIPQENFTTDKFDIKASEDIDDSRSSHPNVKNRKEKAIEASEKYADWGDASNFLGQERFNEIRKLARYERVRTDVLNGQFARALYTIYVLEQENPESYYLKRMKAQSWLGLAQYKISSEYNSTLVDKSDWEGESSGLYYFLKKLSIKELGPLSLRIVEDIRLKFPDKKEIELIQKRLLNELFNDELKLEDYFSYNFQTGVVKFDESLKAKEDEVDEEKKEEKLSKYDKIKQKRDKSNIDNFDSTKYYLYLLSDIIETDFFKEELAAYEDDKEETEKDEAYINGLSKREKKRELERRESLPENSGTIEGKILIVEPIGSLYKKNGINHKKSDNFEEKVIGAIGEGARSIGIDHEVITKRDLKGKSSDEFNDKSILTALLSQAANTEDVVCFPVDYDLLQDIKARYNTTKIMFTSVEHSYTYKFPTMILASVLFPPIAIFYGPLPFMKGNSTTISVAVLDLEKGDFENGGRYYYKSTASQANLTSNFYQVFHSLTKLK